MVLNTGLRVRIEAGLNAPIIVQLLSGTQLLIRQGPIAADGFDWYEVLYPALPDESRDLIGTGWVAVGPTGRPPTMVRIDEPRCPPVPPAASLLGSMGGLARVQCFGADPLEFTAVIDTCYEGPFTPYRYEPDWMTYSCISAFDLGSDAHLDLYFGPSSPDSSGLTRGTVVHLVGHLVDPVAASCRIWTDDSEVPEPSPAMQALFVLNCRSSFVVTELEVVGEINLPSWFD